MSGEGKHGGTWAFTGHRPNKLGGYAAFTKIPYPGHVVEWVIEATRAALKTLAPDRCITGMAQGFDWIGAGLCLEAKIPFIAAVPFYGQETMWPEAAQKKYHLILQRAEKVVVVSPGIFSARKLQDRNEWMVAHAPDGIIACWDGTSGGTKNCVDYAKQHGRAIYRINPKSRTVGHY